MQTTQTKRQKGIVFVHVRLIIQSRHNLVQHFVGRCRITTALYVHTYQLHKLTVLRYGTYTYVLQKKKTGGGKSNTLCIIYLFSVYRTPTSAQHTCHTASNCRVKKHTGKDVKGTCRG